MLDQMRRAPTFSTHGFVIARLPYGPRLLSSTSRKNLSCLPMTWPLSSSSLLYGKIARTPTDPVMYHVINSRKTQPRAQISYALEIFSSRSISGARYEGLLPGGTAFDLEALL